MRLPVWPVIRTGCSRRPCAGADDGHITVATIIANAAISRRDAHDDAVPCALAKVIPVSLEARRDHVAPRLVNERTPALRPAAANGETGQANEQYDRAGRERHRHRRGVIARANLASAGELEFRAGPHGIEPFRR